MSLYHWILSHFDFEFIFTPISSAKYRIVSDGRVTRGVTRYYIFGIRVADFQETVPW